MGRVIIMLCIVMALTTGCAWRVRTEVQEVYVPIVHCPAPPVIERPELPIHNMTPEQQKHPGEVVKHYKATVKDLQGYAQQLERILEEYDKGSELYENMENELFEQLKQEGTIDLP